MIKLLDTFDSLKDFFELYHTKDIDDKLKGWLYYIDNYPELKMKCQSDYENLGLSWKDVAIESSLPLLDIYFDRMIKAHRNIINIVPILTEKIKTIFSITEDIYIVIYYGIGNAAGWATKYNNKPAILLGIEKIAELGWESYESIMGLIYHEMCHIVHGIIRGIDDIGIEYSNPDDKAIWRLYIEGFAQFYEQQLVGREYYHQDSNGWLLWCETNHKYLCEKYLHCILNDIPTKEFYGDWHNVDGYIDVGYYLGCEFIKHIQSRFDINKIACLELHEVKELVIEFLSKAS